MKKFVRVETFWICSKCNTGYNSKKEARRCERGNVEKKIFAVGDLVTNRELRFCLSVPRRGYYFRGMVTKIIGPMPCDMEYEIKWLEGKAERLDSHVFEYRVRYRCPRCRKNMVVQYYAPELKPRRSKPI